MWTDLKAALGAVIKTNGAGEITGDVLNQALDSIVDNVGADASFKGVAIPSTNPGTPDGPVFYLASEKGDYPNFGGYAHNGKATKVISNASGSWVVSDTGIATKELSDSVERGVISSREAGLKETNIVYVPTQSEDINYPSKLGGTLYFNKTTVSGTHDIIFRGVRGDGTYANLSISFLEGQFVAWENTLEDFVGFRIYFGSGSTPGEVDFSIKGVDFPGEVARVDADIAALQSQVNENLYARAEAFDSSIFTIPGFMRPAGTLSTSSVYLRSDYLDVNFAKLYIHTKVASVSVSPAVFFDESYTYISGYTAGDTNEADFEIDVPLNAKYVILSMVENHLGIFSAEADVGVSSFLGKSEKVYVSTTGDDGNTGGISSPFSTIGKATREVSENGEIILREGDYSGEEFDLANINKIRAKTGERVRLIYGAEINAASLSGGYTRVFEAAYAGAINSAYFLWQHDMEDEETVISIEDRHPLHRGRRTRMPSTRVYPAASIAEIESTVDKLMWFLDGGVLYFSKTTGSDLAVNPIRFSTGQTLTASKEKHISMVGIDLLHVVLKTANLSGSIRDVSVGMANASGVIATDKTVGLTLENVEVFGGNNDGFNGHTTDPNTLIYAKQTTVKFINCHGHDNFDDGESHHEYCEVYMEGGLYEFNGSACTPASGCHATYNNVMAANNGGHNWSNADGTGFSAQGSALDGGVDTNVYCYSCLSKNNVIGFRGLDNSSKFINCISQNNITPFENGEQLNCTTL